MRAALKKLPPLDWQRHVATLIPFPRIKRRAFNFAQHLKLSTKRPSRQQHAKLSMLLATEIETAARRIKENIKHGEPSGLEDGLRFVELQISFMREINSFDAERNARMNDDAARIGISTRIES